MRVLHTNGLPLFRYAGITYSQSVGVADGVTVIQLTEIPIPPSDLPTADSTTVTADSTVYTADTL